MKKFVLTPMVALAACGSASVAPARGENVQTDSPAEQQAVVPATAVTLLQGNYETGVTKFCDHGRAVYLYNAGYKQGVGIAVVGGATECREAARR